jgi:hypothetical protein
MVLILVICTVAMFFFFRTLNREKKARAEEIQRKKAEMTQQKSETSKT